MVGLVAQLPFQQIDRIELYVNPQKKSMDTVKTETGCHYIMNAGLFDMTTFQPSSTLTVNGIVLSEACSPYGFAFRGNSVVFSYGNNVKFPYFIGAYPCLIRNGIKDFTYVPAGLGGDRGRSAIGITEDSFIMRCVPDCSGFDDFTLEELYRDMRDLGCTFALNLDGGGSSQANFNGKKIISGRKVHSFICVWLRFPITTVAGFQTWLNHTYGFGIAEDGRFGTATKRACIKAMQKENSAVQDGSWGPASKAAHKSFTIGVTGNRVVILTTLLFRLKFTANITNTFDSAVLNSVKQYQKSAGLTIDGRAGKDTFTSLFN